MACIYFCKTHTRMLMAGLFTIAPNWKLPQCPAAHWILNSGGWTHQNHTQCGWISQVMLAKSDPKDHLLSDRIYTQLQSLQNQSVGIAVRAVTAFREKGRTLDWQQIQGGVSEGASNSRLFWLGGGFVYFSVVWYSSHMKWNEMK